MKFQFVEVQWSCIKTAKLDSTEKARIENRFDTAVLNKVFSN